jgi:hypothetical protein
MTVSTSLIRRQLGNLSLRLQAQAGQRLATLFGLA